MNYQLAIFDMDGTILNTIDDMADGINVILGRYNLPLHTVNEVCFMVGNGIPKLVMRAIPQGSSDELYRKVLKDFIEYYGQHCSEKTGPYKGIPEVILELKKRGLKIGVNTNKLEPAALELCQVYFKGLFDFVCGNANGLPVKPAPDGVFKIMKEAGLNPEKTEDKAKCFYVGDSDVDYKTAANSGLDFIGAAWGFRGEKLLREYGAEKIAIVPEDILKFV